MTLDAYKKDEKILTTIQQEYKILAEYKMIESEMLAGVYVIPSYANSLQWFGVLFGRCGIYNESVFRFSILLPDRFPDEKTVPTIIFQSSVVHPHVCPFTHTLDTSQAFPEWRTGEDHIWQILKYMQTIFNDPLESIRNNNTREVKNSEAAELLINNVEEFKARVKLCVEESKAHIYDVPPTEDPHYIVFEKYQSDVHEAVLERIRKNKNPIPQSSGGGSGLSWVKEGEFKPLSLE